MEGNAACATAPERNTSATRALQSLLASGFRPASDAHRQRCKNS
jgi:hypothetical protein